MKYYVVSKGKIVIEQGDVYTANARWLIVKAKNEVSAARYMVDSVEDGSKICVYELPYNAHEFYSHRVVATIVAETAVQEAALKAKL